LTKAEYKELVAQQYENVSSRFNDVHSAALPTKIYHPTVYHKAEAAAEQRSTESRYVQNCYHQMQYF